MKRAAAIYAVVLFACISTEFLLAESRESFWRRADVSVRMNPKDSNEKTRSAAQTTPPTQTPFQSPPASSGINWQEIVLVCTGVAAVHGLITKFVLQPAMDKRFADFRKTLDAEFVRRPERDDERPVSRWENSMLEERAKREHEILKKDTDGLGERMDREFGRVWSTIKRIMDKDQEEE